jgi:acetyl esterase/lipase
MISRTLCLAALTLVAACGDDDDPQSPRETRCTLLSVAPLASLNAADVAAYLQGFDLDASSVQFGVEAYRITYGTIDTEGRPTTASGLVAWPRDRQGRLHLVSWMHGTIVYRHEVASENQESVDRAAAFLFAAAGYVVSAPDYLGLGAGPGFHPYDHFESATTAAVDALRATHTLVGRGPRQLDPRVLVSGSSQGGPSAMALGKSLQNGGDAELELGALAPISGPYDVSGTFSTALTGQINLATTYLAYLVVAWNRLHTLYASPVDAFRAPYHQTVETLFDGAHPPEEVLGQLPATLDELFTPQFLAGLRNPAGALRQALEEADATCDWRPSVPVRLYGSSGDRDVPIANASRCQLRLRAQGVEADLVDLGEAEHGASVALGLPRVLELFNALRGR